MTTEHDRRILETKTAKVFCVPNVGDEKVNVYYLAETKRVSYKTIKMYNQHACQECGRRLRKFGGIMDRNGRIVICGEMGDHPSIKHYTKWHEILNEGRKPHNFNLAFPIPCSKIIRGDGTIETLPGPTHTGHVAEGRVSRVYYHPFINIDRDHVNKVSPEMLKMAQTLTGENSGFRGVLEKVTQVRFRTVGTRKLFAEALGQLKQGKDVIERAVEYAFKIADLFRRQYPKRKDITVLNRREYVEFCIRCAFALPEDNKYVFKTLKPIDKWMKSETPEALVKFWEANYGQDAYQVKKSAREFAMAKSESHVYLSWIVSSDMDLRVVIKDPQGIVIQIASYQAKGDGGLACLVADQGVGHTSGVDASVEVVELDMKKLPIGYIIEVYVNRYSGSGGKDIPFETGVVMHGLLVASDKSSWRSTTPSAPSNSADSTTGFVKTITYVIKKQSVIPEMSEAEKRLVKRVGSQYAEKVGEIKREAITDTDNLGPNFVLLFDSKHETGTMRPPTLSERDRVFSMEEIVGSIMEEARLVSTRRQSKSRERMSFAKRQEKGSFAHHLGSAETIELACGSEGIAPAFLFKNNTEKDDVLSRQGARPQLAVWSKFGPAMTPSGQTFTTVIDETFLRDGARSVHSNYKSAFNYPVQRIYATKVKGRWVLWFMAGKCLKAPLDNPKYPPIALTDPKEFDGQVYHEFKDIMNIILRRQPIMKMDDALIGAVLDPTKTKFNVIVNGKPETVTINESMIESLVRSKIGDRTDDSEDEHETPPSKCCDETPPSKCCVEDDEEEEKEWEEFDTTVFDKLLEEQIHRSCEEDGTSKARRRIESDRETKRPRREE